MPTKSTTKKAPAKKATPAKKAPAKKSPGKKATPAKKATATKRARNGSGPDLRSLDFTIEWSTADGEFSGQSNGDWGHARYRIKRYFEDHTDVSDAKIKEGLDKVTEAIREGKGAKMGPVTIKVTK